MNRVSLIGRLVADIVLNAVKDSTIGKFTLAVDNKGQNTDFIPCTVWGKTAENMGKYLKKGYPVAVEGRLTQSKWETRGKKYSKIEVTVFNFHFLPNPPDGSKKEKKEESPF